MDYDQEGEMWGTEKRGEDIIPDVFPTPQRDTYWLSLPGLNAGNLINTFKVWARKFVRYKSYVKQLMIAYLRYR